MWSCSRAFLDKRWACLEWELQAKLMRTPCFQMPMQEEDKE